METNYSLLYPECYFLSKTFSCCFIPCLRKWWHLLVDRLSDHMPNYELYTLKTKMTPNVCEPTVLWVISIMEGTNHVWVQLFSLLITHHLSYWGPFPLFLWNKWLNPRCYMAAIQEPFALMLRWYSLWACMPRCACTCVCVWKLLVVCFFSPSPFLYPPSSIIVWQDTLTPVAVAAR